MPKKIDKQAALAKIKGLEIKDVLKFFYDRADARDKQIAELVEVTDELETDGAIVSEGDDNGAFVLTWSWVSFHGTEFSKFCDTCDGEEEVKPIKMRDGTTECLCKACLEEITCPGEDCGAVEGTEEWGTVGDGFDGYCPSCADKREASGEVEIG